MCSKYNLIDFELGVKITGAGFPVYKGKGAILQRALIQFFLKSFPTDVLSKGAAIIRKDVHDTTITTLKYPNDVMCHIFVSWLHPYKEHKFIIVGSKGMISFEDSHKDKPLIYHDKRIDWVDGDSDLVGSSGAEQDDYAMLLPPRMIANEMMVEPSELASVMGYEIFEVQALMPWITALPDKTHININTASDELLIALGGDLDTQFRDAVVANRPFEKDTDFYEMIEREFGISVPDANIRWPDTLVGIETEYFQLYIEVLLGDARIEVKSILNRPSSGKPVIISRDITSVPASLPKDSTSSLQTVTDKSDADEDSDNALENTDMQPACLMIEAF